MIAEEVGRNRARAVAVRNAVGLARRRCADDHAVAIATFGAKVGAAQRANRRGRRCRHIVASARTAAHFAAFAAVGAPMPIVRLGKVGLEARAKVTLIAIVAKATAQRRRAEDVAVGPPGKPAPVVARGSGCFDGCRRRGQAGLSGRGVTQRDERADGDEDEGGRARRCDTSAREHFCWRAPTEIPGLLL